MRLVIDLAERRPDRREPWSRRYAERRGRQAHGPQGHVLPATLEHQAEDEDRDGSDAHQQHVERVEGDQAGHVQRRQAGLVLVQVSRRGVDVDRIARARTRLDRGDYSGTP